MIIPDRKKIATILSGKMGGEMSPMKPEEESGDDDKALHLLAEDAITAVKSGSAADFVKAMKAFMYACDDDDKE